MEGRRETIPAEKEEDDLEGDEEKLEECALGGGGPGAQKEDDNKTGDEEMVEQCALAGNDPRGSFAYLSGGHPLHKNQGYAEAYVEDWELPLANCEFCYMPLRYVGEGRGTRKRHLSTCQGANLDPNYDKHCEAGSKCKNRAEAHWAKYCH